MAAGADTIAGSHTRVFAGASRFGSGRDAGHCGGLFRLAPGEVEWERLAGGLPELAQVRAVVVEPGNADVVWCGTEEGPYRSLDGGDTWALMALPGPSATVWSMGFEPAAPGGEGSPLLVGTAPAALYRSMPNVTVSATAAVRWQLLERAAIPERLDMGFPTRLISLAHNPVDPAEVWAGVEVGGMMHSTDGGLSWTDVTDGLEALAVQARYQSRLLSDTDAEGMLDVHRVTVSPAAPRSAFIALRMGVFRSDDGGASWQDVEVGRFSPLTYCRDVRVSPHDPNVLYAALSDESVGRAGSIYRSDDLGGTWRRYDNIEPTVVSTMMQVAPSPADPDELWCATRRGDAFATVDGGKTWAPYPLPDGGRDIYALTCG
ncbi:MAG: WD40/YVTN/BNR-like repeat-containing protein [Acidimicrobiales bacterium]